MRRQVALAGALALILSAWLAGAASAEQCSSDGKICLLTEATAASPYQPPQVIQVAVDSAADSVRIEGSPYGFGGWAERVAAGPPDGMSVWQTALQPIASDGTTSLEVYAQVGQGPGFLYSFTATFPNLPVQATALFGEGTLQRVGERYVASFSLTARRAVTVSQLLTFTAFEPDFMEKDLTEDWVPTEISPGPGTASMSVAVDTVKQICREYADCYVTLFSIFATEGVRFGGNPIDVKWRVKTPRLGCLRQVERLVIRSKRIRRDPKLRRRDRKRARRLQPRCYDWSVQKVYPYLVPRRQTAARR